MALPIANAGADSQGKHGDGPFTVLPALVTLAGSGTPGTGGTSISAYKWYLDIPAGMVVTINNDAVQAPDVIIVSGAGTVMALLVVTDNLSAESVGPADLATVPDVAFVALEVPHPATGLIPEGNGERQTSAKAAAVVAEVEALRVDLGAHTSAGLHGSVATAAQLDNLINGTTVTGYHRHAASDLTTLAAVGVSGKVELATAPADAGHPKAITNALLTAFLQTTTAAAKLIADNAEVFVFRCPFAGALLSTIHIVAEDGWNGDFDVFTRTEAQYLAGSFGVTLGVVPLTDSAARTKGLLTVSQSVNLGDYIIVCRKTPASVPAAPTKHMVCSLALTVQY